MIEIELGEGKIGIGYGVQEKPEKIGAIVFEKLGKAHKIGIPLEGYKPRTIEEIGVDKILSIITFTNAESIRALQKAVEKLLAAFEEKKGVEN